MSSRSYPLHFLKENVFRKWLNDIYVGLVHSTENCELFVNQNVEDYDFSKIGGNELTKECMRNACQWLQWIKPFIKDRQTFESQFLKPAQITAEYILKIRQKTSTTSIEGWVFSKSEPYDYSHFGNERITVSMIVPALKTIMSIRVRTEEGQNIDYGFNEFREVQPIPLVNRLYQSHPRISPIKKELPLKNCDFLKVFFDDFEKFSDSIEMSNFCEIDSTQSKLRHHLGSAFVVPCKIIRAKQPRITIQSTVSNSTKTIVMSEQFLKNHDYEYLDSLKNKTARILVVQWYDPGDEDDLSKSSELMSIELEENIADLKNDELIGYVRLRNNVSCEKIRDIFGDINFDSLACLQPDQENVKFKIFEKPQDSVTDEFLHSVELIRKLRSSSREDECVQLNYFDVINSEKLSFVGLANLVKNDVTMSNVLNCIHKTMDKKGERMNIQSLVSKTGIVEEKIRRKTSWLAYLGILEKTDGMLKITSKGKEVSFLAIKNKIRDEVYNCKQDTISIPEFKTEFSPTLLCKFLEKPESGYLPIVLDNGKNKLFWVRTSSDEIKKTFQDKFDFMKSQFILAMRSTNYPFTTQKAVEEILKVDKSIDFFSAEIIIRELVKEKILIPYGESWELPLQNRIMSLLKENPDCVFTLDEIISLLSIPLMHKEDTANILSSLQTEEKVSVISPNGWSLKGNDAEKSQKRMNEMLLKRTLVLLRSKQHGLDEEILVGMMDKITSDLSKDNKFLKKREIVREALKILKEDDRISIKDGIYKIKK